MRTLKPRPRTNSEHTRQGILLAAVLGFLDVSCSAPAGAGGAEPSKSSTDSFQSVDAEGKACNSEPGRGVLRRLTDPEYQSSLKILFGRDDFPEGHPLTGNTVSHGYSTNADGLWIRDLDFQTIRAHTQAIGDWVATTDPTIVASCTEFDQTCANTFISNFGRRAFLAPVRKEQVDRYTAVFLSGDDFQEGLSMVVSTMLQSPYFLYRREVGRGEGETVVLDDYELGTALAFYITGLPPDTELQAVMESENLRDPTQWDAQVDRLLDTPAAEEKIIEFVIEWLALDRVFTQTKTEDGVVVPASLRESMMGEVKSLTLHVFRTGGSFRDLLANDSVFINGELAAHYGLEGPTGPEFQQTPAGNRTGGLLGTGAYLLGHSRVDSSSPTQRGLFIRERLLCSPVPPPPPTVNTELPPLEGLTTRQRAEQHLASPACAKCHSTIDNFGHAFENYDGLGRYRTSDNGTAVDSTGTTAGMDAGELPFADSHELIDILVSEEQVKRCFYQHLTEYVVGQKNWDNLCSVNYAASAAETSGGSLKDALKAVLSLPHLEARLAQGASL